MKQSHLYFLAAALVLVATAINLANDGPNIWTAIYLAIAGIMIVQGLRNRRQGA